MTEPARGAPPLPTLFTTMSGLSVEERYGPPRENDASPHIGKPGKFPFIRGIHRNMHRCRLWTKRQFAGFGSAEDTNAHFRYLLSQGQDGLSVGFDMPTFMGYDSDHERALGEVGREGVAIASLADMEALFAGIPLDKVRTSMTINAPAAILYAMYVAVAVAVAERAGVPRSSLRGKIQNDCLKEFIAQKEWLVPPRPSMKLVIDTLLFAARETPLWNPISISGYHIREAGATAVRELAFTLADGIAYLEAGVAARLAVDGF
ncbi:MAG: methylmalonyl-CoA mutase, partial [Armatimonadetes bacterium]|nr:methylmalonyl-CoA mutase [Armatimonadota bacterium]